MIVSPSEGSAEPSLCLSLEGSAAVVVAVVVMAAWADMSWGCRGCCRLVERMELDGGCWVRTLPRELGEEGRERSHYHSGFVQAYSTLFGRASVQAGTAH